MKERLLALEALLGVFLKGAFSNSIIDETINNNELSPVQKSFFTRLFLGTLEKAYFLDAIIDQVASEKTKKQRPVILNILRLSVYQLYFLDQVPAHAAIDCAVGLCEKKKMRGLKGFVNAVLRNIERQKKELFENASKDAAILLSLPGWLYSYMKEAVGESALSHMLLSADKNEGIYVRVNTAKASLEEAKEELVKSGINFVLVDDLPFFNIKDFGSIEDIPHFKEGWFYIQDPNSILGIKEAGIRPGDNILDVCAAPGGKSFFASGLTGPAGKVMMCDISEKKVLLMRENAKRLGIENVTIVQQDALSYNENFEGAFDLVIADLPCSGLGTIHKKPEIRYRIGISDVNELAKMQRDMLGVACKYVKKGGRMIYSTCTMGHIENEDNTEWFLREWPEFCCLRERVLMPGGGRDGFYYALFERKLGTI